MFRPFFYSWTIEEKSIFSFLFSIKIDYQLKLYFMFGFKKRNEPLVRCKSAWAKSNGSLVLIWKVRNLQHIDENNCSLSVQDLLSGFESKVISVLCSKWRINVVHYLYQLESEYWWEYIFIFKTICNSKQYVIVLYLILL